MVAIGQMRHQVSVKGPLVPTKDDLGGWTEARATLGSAWPAAIEPATASNVERVFGAAIQARTSHVVTIRYLSGVTPSAQVVYGSRTFDVVGIQNPDERNRWLVLACEEQVTG